MTASAWFFARARLAGERVALVDGTGSPPLWGSSPGKRPFYTYRALAERALRLAVLLKERGIGKGDRIALLSQNHVAYVDLLLAAASLGAILVPFNIRLPEGELRPLQEDAAPALLFYHPDLAALAAHLPGEKISLGDHYEEDLSRVPRERAKALEEALFKGEMGAGLEDPWLILYTGGTTGVPKGALIPHRQVIFNAINTTGSWELTSEDAAPVFTPLFHTGGLHVFLTPLLHSGGKLVLGGAFQPEKAVELTREEGLTLFFAVPTMYQLLLDEPSFRKANLQTVRWFISGGAPCPLPIYEAFAAQGLLFKEGYGLTEAGPNNFALPLEKLTEKRGSVGLPVLHARAKVVDDTGQDLPPGAVGELLLGGPHLFSGYWQKEEETKKVLREGWLHTGDLAYRDEEGFFFIAGRKKDLIISGGENIYPQEIETVLLSHPAVLEAAVVGIPDPKWGEAVKAVVVLRPGERVTEETLASFCRGHLAGYKIPKRWEFREELPKNAAGKILKRELSRPERS